MGFHLESGVKWQEYSSGRLIGVYFPNTPNHWAVGAYDFSNVHSANMFSYLFRHVGFLMAKAAVIEMETKLTGNDAKKVAFKTIIDVVDWKTLATGNAPVALVGTLKNAVSTATDIVLGGVVRSALMSGYGQYNPFPPVDKGQLWAPDSLSSEFISYAIGYWRQNPINGPAYISSGKMYKP